MKPIIRYAAVYGGLSGLVIVGTILGGLSFADRSGFFGSIYFGYLVMLIALAFIFMGVKRYRDIECGGVIRFLPALGAGLAIAGVAALAYVLVWEAYLAATDYAFMGEYIAEIHRTRVAAGIPAAQLAKEMAEWEVMRVQYQNPLFRIPMTFCEIFPVGLIVSLVSAAILRNPRILPARA